MLFAIRIRVTMIAAVAASLGACAGPRGGSPDGSSLDAASIGQPPEPPPPARREATRDVATRGSGGQPRSEAVPTVAEIFDFHPPGSRPGSWREPFVVSYSEGPLNGYRLRTLAELQRLRDHRYDLAPPSALAQR